MTNDDGMTPKAIDRLTDAERHEMSLDYLRSHPDVLKLIMNFAIDTAAKNGGWISPQSGGFGRDRER